MNPTDIATHMEHVHTVSPEWRAEFERRLGEADPNENPWDIASFDFSDLVPRRGPSPTIVEVGGYEGRWLMGMSTMHRDARLVAFEPQDWARERLRARFAAEYGDAPERRPVFLELFPFGLGIEDGSFPMGGWHTDACSFLLDDAYFAAHPEEGRNEVGIGELREVTEVFRQYRLNDIDVLCMNIEGYEYLLLPHMGHEGLLANVEHLMVQFHTVHDPEGAAEVNIRAGLAETHDLAWEWPALSCWSRRR